MALPASFLNEFDLSMMSVVGELDRLLLSNRFCAGLHPLPNEQRSDDNESPNRSISKSTRFVSYWRRLGTDQHVISCVVHDAERALAISREEDGFSEFRGNDAAEYRWCIQHRLVVVFHADPADPVGVVCGVGVVQPMPENGTGE